MVSRLFHASGQYVAYSHSPATMGSRGCVVYLPGLKSPMHGEKASALQRACQQRLGFDFYSLEYRGHGDSALEFLECTLEDWVADVLLLVDHILSAQRSGCSSMCSQHSSSTRLEQRSSSGASSLQVPTACGAGSSAADAGVATATLQEQQRAQPPGSSIEQQPGKQPEQQVGERHLQQDASPLPLILVGSSMGAWLALLAALERPHSVSGLVLLAPAVDICSHWATLGGVMAGSDGDGNQLLRLPSNYVVEGYIIMRVSGVEAATKNMLLGTGRLAAITCPVQILHSSTDEVVPLELVLALAKELERSSNAFAVELLPDGDHRMNREADLASMEAALARVVASLALAAQLPPASPAAAGGVP